MSKIKIYDADAFIRKEANMACHTFGQVAVFQGPKGVIVAEEEAVHDMFQSIEDAFSFHLTKIPSPGKRMLIPTHSADIPVKEIMNHAPSKEVDFYDFFSRRNYNPRTQNNFRYLCGHLREIGYEIPKEPLSQKVQAASAKAAAGKANTRLAPAQERI